MRKEGYVIYTVRVPDEVDREFRELAHSERSSLNRTVLVAMERYIRAWRGRQQRAQGRDD